MTKTTRRLLPVVGIAWLLLSGACAPQGDLQPDATVQTQEGVDSKDTALQPAWLDCMAEDDCIAGARVRVLQDVAGECQIHYEPWSGSDSTIRVFSRGRVFFLVQWQKECGETRVHLKNKGQNPWRGNCHQAAWVRPGPKSFVMKSCEIVESTNPSGDPYDFCLEDEEGPCSPDRVGGNVLVRGSGGGVGTDAGPDTDASSGPAGR